MDTIKFEKVQAMNKYRNRNQFYKNLTLYSLATLSCSLLCSSPFWFPTLCSYVNAVFSVFLPNIVSFFFNPKCLFIVGNIIIVFLIGESKFVSTNPSPATEIYDEYVIRSRSLRRLPIPSDEKKEEDNMEVSFIEESQEKVVEEESKEEDAKEEDEKEEEHEEKLQAQIEVEDKQEQGEEDEENVEEEDKQEQGGEDEENVEEEDLDGEYQEEEELGLPTDELNKRVEDFIARMNEQRRLEATLLVYSSA